MHSSSGLVTATRSCRLRGVGQFLGGLGLLLLALASGAPALAGPGAQQVVAGDLHTCTLTDTGGVWCWGANQYGQLGNGTTTQSTTPVAVNGLSGVTALAAGGAHTCALTDTGDVWCWGWNQFGQLGDNTTGNKFTPVAVTGLSDVTTLAAGFAHTCALLNDTNKTVKCWGSNSSGQLGVDNNTTPQSNTPVAVTGLSDVTTLAAGFAHTCALLTDKTVMCWGDNFKGQLGDGTNTLSAKPVAVTGLSGVAALAAGYNHTCALLTDEAVKCWGLNASGQLGDNTTADKNTPVAVKDVAGTGPLSGVTVLSAGGDHTCALLTDTFVQCWGNNRFGQLGNNSTTNSSIPVATRNRDNSDNLFWVMTLAAGGVNTCGVTDTGAVWCWGNNQFGQLGDGSTTNSSLPVVTRTPATLGLSGTLSGSTTQGSTAQVAAGYVHTCALTNGAAWCWGDNVYGELGNGRTERSSTPVAVSGLGSGVTVLEAGLDHTCALMSDTTVKCWGINAKGQLGAGASAVTQIQSTPVIVKDQAGMGALSGVTSLSAGKDHTCALKGGAPWCWGNNGWGQLGIDNVKSAFTPTPVPSLSSGGVTALAAGYSHTCALMSDTTVKCWGINLDGQLGNNSSSQNSKIPVVVSDLTGVAALSAGYYHTCALLTDKTVKCWGGNDYGQLGNGDKLDQKEPAAVDLSYLPSGETVMAVSAGRYHTCVLTNTGGVWCWGRNAEGQLGTGTTVDSTVPVAAKNQAGTADLTGVTEVSAGGHHTCSRLSTGEVQCWGWNLYGQLGTTGFVSVVSSPTVSNTVTITATTAWPVTNPANLTLEVTGNGITPSDYQITLPGGVGPPASMPANRSFTAPQDNRNHKGATLLGPANVPLDPPYVMTIPYGGTSASLLFTVLMVSDPEGAETATLTLTNPEGNIVLGSPVSAFLTLLDTAAPPTNVTVTPGDRSLTVSFTPSAGATSYTATCTSSDGGASATAIGTASPITVTGLTNGKTYTCTVTTSYGQASSDPSPASDPVIVQAPVAIPTLSQWALLMLGGLLAAFGMRRRQRLPTQ